MELGPFVIELNDENINSVADDEGEWVLNENLAIEYVLSTSVDTSN